MTPLPIWFLPAVLVLICYRVYQDARAQTSAQRAVRVARAKNIVGGVIVALLLVLGAALLRADDGAQTNFIYGGWHLCFYDLFLCPNTPGDGGRGDGGGAGGW